MTGPEGPHGGDVAPLDAPAAVGTVFVYGTLLPGEVRWHHLAPYVVDGGWPDSVVGELYDTGLGYPAALFRGDGSIRGHCFALLSASRAEALAVLDEVEGAVHGLYRRTVVVTETGSRAFAYEYGGGLHLERIDSGDWLTR